MQAAYNVRVLRVLRACTRAAHFPDCCILPAMNVSPRIKPFLIHLCISAFVAAAVAAIIFFVWYPHPYRTISGGAQLFFMIVSIDVIMGPLCTLIICKPQKSRLALGFDYTTIGLLQLAALAYGTWTMAVARPVHMVFEKDLFRVAHATEIEKDLLKDTPPGIEALPLTGPDMLSIKMPEKTDKKNASLDLALAGTLEAFQPALWVPYDGKAAFAAAREMDELRKRLPKAGTEIDAAVRAAGVPEGDLRWTVVVGRQFVTWTTLLDRDGRIAAYLPLDPDMDTPLVDAPEGKKASAAASAASDAASAPAPAASVASAP